MQQLVLEPRPQFIKIKVAAVLKDELEQSSQAGQSTSVITWLGKDVCTMGLALAGGSVLEGAQAKWPECAGLENLSSPVPG